MLIFFSVFEMIYLQGIIYYKGGHWGQMAPITKCKHPTSTVGAGNNMKTYIIGTCNLLHHNSQLRGRVEITTQNIKNANKISKKCHIVSLICNMCLYTDTTIFDIYK